MSSCPLWVCTAQDRATTADWLLRTVQVDHSSLRRNKWHNLSWSNVTHHPAHPNFSSDVDKLCDLAWWGWGTCPHTLPVSVGTRRRHRRPERRRIDGWCQTGGWSERIDAEPAVHAVHHGAVDDRLEDDTWRDKRFSAAAAAELFKNRP